MNAETFWTFAIAGFVALVILYDLAKKAASRYATAAAAADVLGAIFRGVGLSFRLIGRSIGWFFWVAGGCQSDGVMSNDGGDDDRSAVDQAGQQRTTNALSVIATPDNDDNDGFPVVEQLPDSARDIIRFQAKVEALAALLRTEQVSNKAKAIERVFECSRSSKEDSTYQRVLRALEPLTKTGPQFVQTDGSLKPATYPVSGERRSS